MPEFYGGGADGPCALPFNRAHVSREGYLRLCCDYENLLAVEDLKRVPLIEAWQGPRFREIRRRHLADQLTGTLCQSCVHGGCDKAAPLNPALT